MHGKIADTKLKNKNSILTSPSINLLEIQEQIKVCLICLEKEHQNCMSEGQCSIEVIFKEVFDFN